MYCLIKANIRVNQFFVLLLLFSKSQTAKIHSNAKQYIFIERGDFYTGYNEYVLFLLAIAVDRCSIHTQHEMCTLVQEIHDHVAPNRHIATAKCEFYRSYTPHIDKYIYVII